MVILGLFVLGVCFFLVAVLAVSAFVLPKFDEPHDHPPREAPLPRKSAR